MALTPVSDEEYVKNSKNLETLRDFCLYCKNNPEMRFWQALRNWGRVANWLVFSKTWPAEGQIDTFNFKGKDK